MTVLLQLALIGATLRPSASDAPASPDPAAAEAAEVESRTPERPTLLPMRQDEDWRALRNPAERTRPLDAAKYVGFGDHDAYLTFGGELRTAYELFVNEDYGRVAQDDSGSWLLRAMAHTNLRLGSHFRAFAQFKSTHEAGRDGGPTPVDVDRLDLHQGFAEFSLGDPRRTDRTSFSVRTGRQELAYGAGRLVDVRDGPAVRRSFDTVLARLASPILVVDALFGLEVPVNPGVFDDVGEQRPRLWGTYLRSTPGTLGRFGLDAYYLGVAQGSLVYVAGPGTELRHSIGGRWWSAAPQLRHDVEFTAQRGRFVGTAQTPDAKIRAWGLAGSLAYAFTPDGWRPEVSVSTGVTSGDTSSEDGTLETFRSPFPNLRFAGATTRLGPSNIYGANAGFGVSPVPGVRLALTGRTFWRTSTADAVYSPVGFPQRASASNAAFVGGNAGLFGAWFPNEYVTVYGMAEVFQPGTFLRTAPPAETSLFFTLGSKLQF